jgi:Tol biopolymer transport system component
MIAEVRSPSWSADGDWIVFIQIESPILEGAASRIHLVRPDGSDLTAITTADSDSTTHAPIWAPDGSLYYGLSGVSDEPTGIYRYDLDAQSHTLIIAGNQISPLRFSPDGELLLYRKTGFNGLKVWIFAEQQAVEIPATQANTWVKFVGWVVGE